MGAIFRLHFVPLSAFRFRWIHRLCRMSSLAIPFHPIQFSSSSNLGHGLRHEISRLQPFSGSKTMTIRGVMPPSPWSLSSICTTQTSQHTNPGPKPSSATLLLGDTWERCLIFLRLSLFTCKMGITVPPGVGARCTMISWAEQLIAITNNYN